MSDGLYIVYRTLGAITFLYIITRILGKKQISQLTFFEYITGITLGELAGFISTDVEANYWHGVIALFIWAAVPFSLELISLKSKTFRNLIEGKGTIIIKDGKVLEDNLKKEHYSSDELLEQLRKKDVFNVADVEYAVLETTGDLNVLLKKENMPLTPKNLGIKVAMEQEPQTVIMDGAIMDEPLATIGLNREWLDTELEKIGVSLDNVYLGQVDSFQQLYVDLFDDMIKVPEPQTREVLLATLKKCESDLELFCLTTKNIKAKMMYNKCVGRMKTVIAEVTPQLKR